MMTFKQVMAGLFSTAEGTYYKWKKEKRPIITLLEKYFTKEDLEEFLEYGTIEKLEFANSQDYGYRVAEFVKLLKKLQDFLYQDFIHNTIPRSPSGKDISEVERLDHEVDFFVDTLDYIEEIEKVENEGLSYLALAFANIPSQNSEEDFTSDNLSKFILYCYDKFQKSEIQNKDSMKWVNSVLLGNFLDTFKKEYPKYPEFNHMLFKMYKNDFISFVKLCFKYQPKNVNTAIWFCIKFNLYKYDSDIEINDIYEQVAAVFPSNWKEPIKIETLLEDQVIKFDFEKFKTEIQKIQQSRK